MINLMINSKQKNLDSETIKSFGDEWTRFDQSILPGAEAQKIFNEYFDIFPWESLPINASGFDMGCGSGRWAKLMAPRVGHLHCIEPSSALEVARTNLSSELNVTFHRASVEDCLMLPNSQDFGYALGVLHHVPDAANIFKTSVEFLKPGAPFLVYVYYAFENRSSLFKLIWLCSDLLRRIICKFPSNLKLIITTIFAIFLYYPLARFSLLLERWGIDVASIPLSYYRHHSFYTMRTDSRDRFGTPLEQRFTRAEITKMMENAGLSDVRFSTSAPYWCAVGIKR
jgi:SAM-dependent methyltransferase